MLGRMKEKLMKSVGLSLVFVSLCILLGCGAASNGSSSSSSRVRVLQAVEINPSSSSVAAGLTEQFTATGKYDDGSTKDLTRSATWQSSNTGLATISSSGLLSSKA